MTHAEDVKRVIHAALARDASLHEHPTMAPWRPTERLAPVALPIDEAPPPSCNLCGPGHATVDCPELGEAGA